MEIDSEKIAVREEAIQMQRGLEDQLATEQATMQDLNEQVEMLTERKKELKQQVSALQGELDESRGLIGGYHKVVVVWGGGLMERKEELKQQMSALQGELDDSKRAYRWVS